MKKMRTYDIIDYVKSKKRASLAELMAKFDVSSATIHRDVAELVASGHLERIRGGVAFFPRSNANVSGGDTISYLDRATVNLSAKKRIAIRAIELVADGDILFLDSSTTTAAFADELANRQFINLTIVTNSVAIMEKFRKMPRNYVLISLGGNYDPLLNSFLGSAALRELERLTRTTSTRRDLSRRCLRWRRNDICSPTGRSSDAPASTVLPPAPHLKASSPTSKERTPAGINEMRQQA